MSAIFISSLGDYAEELSSQLIDISIAELELFVKDVGPRIIKAVEEDVEYALNNYVMELEVEKQKPQSAKSDRRIDSLERAIKTMKKFPGTLSLFTRDNAIVISYSDIPTSRALNFGTKDIPKLDPNGRIVNTIIFEAARKGIELKREHLIY